MECLALEANSKVFNQQILRNKIPFLFIVLFYMVLYYYRIKYSNYIN